MAVSTSLVTVGELSRRARVSVRTLHHYDRIGLVSPSQRSEAGYRLYGRADLERLQQVLFFRELGFGLAEIRRILSDPGFDRRPALRAQRALLHEKRRRLGEMVKAIDAALAARKGDEMGATDLSMFGGFEPADYEAEVRERWGDTRAYRQSSERAARHTKADWERIRAEQEALTAAFIERMDAGDRPESAATQAVVERHHAHLQRWFYDCPPTMYAGLARMWVEDPRFTESIDRARTGLAAYQSAAAVGWANARGANGGRLAA